MTKVRVFLTMTEKDRDALRALASRQRRDPRDQAAFLLRQALEASGAYQLVEQDAANESVTGHTSL